MLNFEHSAERPGQFKGATAIVQKLQSLPFQQAKASSSHKSARLSRQLNLSHRRCVYSF